jgi:hypothetical protein
MTKTAQVKTLKSYFQGSKAKREFFAGEELVEYDVDQLLSWEVSFHRHQLLTRGTGDGSPSFALLLGCWRRARDSFERVMKALPVGELRDAMAIELADRDASMDDLADKACAMIATKLAKGEVDA